MLFGCATNEVNSYQELIRSEFIASDNFRIKEPAKVIVVSAIENKSLAELLDESGLLIDPTIFAGYEIIYYTVFYDGPYWLERYQVFRLCDKNTCKHKYLLIVGIYA